MEIEWLPIAEGWELEVHYRPKRMVMDTEIALVFLQSPDSGQMDITDVWPLIFPGLVGQLVMKVFFNHNGA